MEFPACVGCGYCCISFPCSTAIHNGWGDGYNRCNKLYWNGSMYRCSEASHNETLQFSVGIGAGCPSTLFNTWRSNVKER